MNLPFLILKSITIYDIYMYICFKKAMKLIWKIFSNKNKYLAKGVDTIFLLYIFIIFIHSLACVEIILITVIEDIFLRTAQERKNSI